MFSKVIAVREPHPEASCFVCWLKADHEVEVESGPKQLRCYKHFAEDGAWNAYDKHYSYRVRSAIPREDYDNLKSFVSSAISIAQRLEEDQISKELRDINERIDKARSAWKRECRTV